MNIDNESNPSVAPTSSDDYELSRYDRSVLELYLKLRDRPISLALLLSQFLLVWFVILVLFAAIIGTVFLLLDGSHIVLCIAFVTGAFLAMISRDIGYSWRIVRRWPLTASVLDWEKIVLNSIMTVKRPVWKNLHLF